MGATPKLLSSVQRPRPCYARPVSSNPTRRRMPLAAQILIAVSLAVLAAATIGAPLIPYGELGTVVIRLLKLLATPLVFFAVIDAFLRIDIPVSKGARLLALSAVNACVATAIGLGLAQLL